MAGFEYEKHHPFLLDSFSSSPLFLFPNTSAAANLSPTTNFQNNYSPCFSPLPHHHPFYDPPHPTVELSSSITNTNTAEGTTCCSNNSSSSVVTAPHQLINPIHKRKNNFQFPHSNMNEKKQRKASSNNSSIDEGCIMRSDGGEEKTINKKKNKRGDDQKKDGEEIEKEAPAGYIHVRARRGQATDSHSLAERVRREKISERMKVLQALVPGCDKVTGKALMLDEIINYVQSLQNQVEFLSMKIASVNPMIYDFGMDWDAVMVKPERMGNSEAAEENQNKVDTTNIFNYTLDHSSLLQFQQTHMPNIMSHPQSNINGQLIWNRNEQSQKISSQLSSGGEYVEGAYMKR